MTSILPCITFLLFQGRFDSLVCPPKHPEESASVWVRAVAHGRETSVITFPFSSFLTCIPSFQVHGAEALEQIQKALSLIHGAQKSDHNTADKPKPADDVPGGDEGRDDEGSGSGFGSQGDHEGHLIAISQWRGLFTDDVSWRLGGCYSFL